MQTLRKLKVLYWFAVNAFCEWKAEIWDKDLDERFCCDGQMCGCGGSTVGETFGLMKRGKSDI